MDLGIAEIQNEIARELGQNGTGIVLTWDQWPADSVKDQVDGSRPGTPTKMTATLPAFVHYVQVAGQSSVRQFAEVEVGDVILDFQADVNLSGKENLRFNLKGQIYEPKQIGDKLAATWDVLVQGQQLFRTVLVTKAR